MIYKCSKALLGSAVAEAGKKWKHSVVQFFLDPLVNPCGTRSNMGWWIMTEDRGEDGRDGQENKGIPSVV